MATKKKKKEANFTGFKEIKKLWTSVSPQDWIQLFQELAPEQGWQVKGTSTVIAKCPYHDDETPSFSINFSKGIAKCFGACGKTVVDLVSFTAKLKAIPYTEALMLLNSRFNLGNLLGEKSASDLVAYNNLQEMKKMTAIAANKLVEEIIRDNPDYLDYCRPGVAYLIKGRELPASTLIHLPVGIYGKPEHMKKYIDSTFHDLYDSYFKEYQNNSYYGSIMTHYNTNIGTISRFKLKKIDYDEFNKVRDTKDFMELPKDFLRNLYSKVFTYVSDPYTESIGVYGLHFYAKMLGRGDSNCYVTEGEFDVLSTMSKQLLAEKIEFMMLGTGGRGSTNLSFLKEFDIKTIWMVSDTPAKNGDDYVLSILGDKHNYEQSSVAKSLQFKIFTWPKEILGMDLDEAMRMNDFEVVTNFLYNERNGLFLNSFPWISNKCDREISGIKREIDGSISMLDTTSESYPIQFSNLNDEKRNKIKDSVLKWYQYVKDPTDRIAFIQRYKVSEDIDLDKLESVATSMYALDTYDGVIKRLVDETLTYFTPAYYKRTQTGEILTLWAHKTENQIDLVGTEKNMYDIIAQHVGKPIINWFDELLPGNPVYLDKTGESEMENAVIKRKNARNLMQHVWEHLRSNIKYVEDLLPYSQGVQYADLPAQVRGNNYCYFINGKLVFRGQFLDDDKVEWERIRGITDGDLLFTETRNSERWSEISDITDLYEATSIDLLETYKTIKRILGAWKFKDDEVYQEYLAAYIMSIPIMRAVGNTNITFITGERESGKTSFTNGLLGGGIIGRGGAGSLESLMECTKFLTDLSPAALYQTFTDKGLLCIIDEAENSNSNSKKANDQMHDVWKLMYSLPMSGSVISRGGVTRDQRTEYKLRMPVLMSATTTPKDPTFRSRVLFVYTMKEPGRMDPVDYIQNIITDEDFKRLKRNITIGLIPFIPKIIQLKSKLKHTLPSASVELDIISNRFVDCVITPLSVYEFIGAGRASDLYKKIVTVNKDRLISLHGVDTQSEIINACLYSENIKLINDAGVSDKIAAKALILSGEINMLNNFKSGIYFIDDQGWIIIVWRQVKYSILKNAGGFWGVSESTMRELASKNQFVENEITEGEHKYIVEVLGLDDVKNPIEYTVVHKEYLIRADKLRNKTLLEKNPANNEPAAELEMKVEEVEGPTQEIKPEKINSGDLDLEMII